VASSRPFPHISADGRNAAQTPGRSGDPNKLHVFSDVRLQHRMPAGFPDGMPGMGEVMDITTQHAPQPTLQSMATP
jgi:hypothetical protein